MSPAAHCQPAKRTLAFAPRRPKQRRARGMLAVFALIAALFVIAPLCAPHDPAQTSFLDRLAPPSFSHPLGTDQLGRDVLSRLLHGFAVTPVAAAAVVVFAVSVGGAVGLVCGMTGGLVDRVAMRLVEGILAVPALAVALIVAGVVGIGLATVVVALAAVHAAEYARLVRNLVMAEREKAFVLAAHALGTPPLRVVTRHIVPGIAQPVAAMAAFSFSYAVLSFAGLSFLGLGAPPGAAEWGAMIAEARSHMRTHPHLILAPGLTIMATVLAANLIGDHLGDRGRRTPSLLYLHPKKKELSQ